MSEHWSPVRIVSERFLRDRFPGWFVPVDFHLARRVDIYDVGDGWDIRSHGISFLNADYEAWSAVSTHRVSLLAGHSLGTNDCVPSGRSSK